MKDITILLIEDQKLIRAGIKTLFEEAGGFIIAGEAENGSDACILAEKLKPDIILLDLGLPDKSGIKVIQELQATNLPSKIIVLTGDLSRDAVLKCLQLGVFAYAGKDIGADMLVHIAKSVHNGAMWLDPRAVSIIRERPDYSIPQKNLTRTEFRNSHANLTQREYEVLRLIVDGRSNSDIAKELCISTHTAKAHVCSIIQKLVVDDRTQAAVKALKEGLVG